MSHVVAKEEDKKADHHVSSFEQEKEWFDQYNAKKYMWTQKEKFAEEIAAISGFTKEDVVKGLVNYRDFIDCEMYCTAAKNLFGTGFTVRPVSDSFVKEGPDGRITMGLEFYVLKVYFGHEVGRGVYDKDVCATIAIAAPGSRTLTSDIDTTLSVSLPPEKIQQLAQAIFSKHHEDPTKYDLALWIQAALIREFHNINESRSHMTSALHRDSNVYSNGFLGQPKDDDREHPLSPKFYNPVINGDDFMNTVERVNFYAINKQNKHRYEMVASFFPLCRCDAWEAFKDQLTSESESDSFEFEAPQRTAIQDDFGAIITDVEKWCTDAKAAVILEMDRIRAEKTLKTVLPDTHIEKDIEISANNNLYVQHLFEVAQKAKQLRDLSETKETSIMALAKLSNELRDKKDFVKHVKLISEHNQTAKDKIAQVKQEISQLEKPRLAAIDALKKVLKVKADFQNELQRARIYANLFAYEGYINRSAAYHVVEGMQTDQAVALSRQTVVGSALQQIGFKLLHDEVPHVLPKSSIAYKTAKYGQRVGHLLFGQKESLEAKDFRGLPVNGKIAGKSIMVLSVLCKKEEKVSFHNYLAAEEYELVDEQAKLAKVKDKQISESAKCDEAKLLSEEHQRKLKIKTEELYQEKIKELWLAIAAKVYLIGYKARLRKGHLWGGQATVSEIAEKKEKTETSAPPRTNRGSSKNSVDATINEQNSQDTPVSIHHGTATAVGARAQKDLRVLAFAEGSLHASANSARSKGGALDAMAINRNVSAAQLAALYPKKD